MKMLKIFLLGWLTIVFCGCSGIDHDSREALAESFVTAIADGDEEAVWTAFAPEFRERLLAGYQDDESKAKSELLKGLQEGLKKRCAAAGSLEDFPESEAFEKAVKSLLAGDAEKFVQIGEKWYLNVDIQ